ncbi:MAG TPA: class I SAM-dependent methyltransferase [Rhizomicrobium sp.]|jgi:SAM-dependent methyltransferase|nr:class I SAM-dependent methyltransferase [Rhizomicrobium sp.]
MSAPAAQFFNEYARHRAAEGRALRGEDLRSLPYLRAGPLARQWAVRAKTFEAFVNRIVGPLAGRGALDILDLGAGNGWLCYRLACSGHHAIALDLRDDDIDGLGAAADLATDSAGRFHCVRASFESLPFADRSFDLAIFNASLHYATELGRALAETVRVTRPGGMLAVLDSPFYPCERAGQRMVAEKKAQAADRFGPSADVLVSQNFIEFLTRQRLKAARGSLSWSRHRVRYPLWYEMRPLFAWLRGRRRPSRFDVWSARVP